MQKVMNLPYPPRLVFLYEISLFTSVDRLIFICPDVLRLEKHGIFRPASVEKEDSVFPCMGALDLPCRRRRFRSDRETTARHVVCSGFGRVQEPASSAAEHGRRVADAETFPERDYRRP